MMRAAIFLCWLASLVVLASLVLTGFGLPPDGWVGAVVEGYRSLRDVLPLGLPGWLRDVALFYLLFGMVEKAVSEWAYDYAGLVAKYRSRATTAKAGRAIGMLTATLLWPVSIALDILAVLVWNSDAGEAARDASRKTLRSLRFGLSKEEVSDVVGRYGRLTYMARPLFVCALCLTYITLMIFLI